MRRRRSSLTIFLSFLTVVSFILFLSYVFLQRITVDWHPLPPPHGDEVQVRLQVLENEIKENERLLTNVRRRVIQVSRTAAHRLELNNISDKCYTSTKSNNVTMTVEQIYEQISFEDTDGGVWKQGWPVEVDAGRKSGPKLKVFVVPHSHNDPGWIKTFDAYFKDQTRHILNNMLSFLTQNPAMKFIWAETSYFALWWDELTPENREKVKSVVSNGQLEFVTGGWVMNDEASTHISAIITQMVEGHEWLKENLNVTPRTGWAIDPFGLSSTMAFVLKKMGLKEMVIARVHYSLKKYMASEKMLEFHWRQVWEQQEQNHKSDDILTHVMPFYSYDVPHTCGPDPKVCCQFDFRRMPPFKLTCPWKENPQEITKDNIDARAKLLADQYWKKAMLFKSNSVLVPLGDDFRYEKREEWMSQFRNYRKLFMYINSQPGFNMDVKFGTLTDYFNSIASESESYPSLSGDFFTYADREDHYWSGYYTTRPFYKRFDRMLQNHLLSTELLFTWNSILRNRICESKEIREQLDYIRKAHSLFQHHDAITGTAKDKVVNDYAQRMFTAITYSQEIMRQMMRELIQTENQSHLLDGGTKDHKPNELRILEIFPDKDSLSKFQVLSVDQSTKVKLLAFNNQGSERSELLCFRISLSTTWTLTDWEGNEIPVQLSYVWQENGMATDQIEACFKTLLQPLSISSFFIEGREPASQPLFSHVRLYNYNNFNLPQNDMITKQEAAADITVKLDQLEVIISGQDGMLKGIGYPKKQQHYDTSLQFRTFGTRNKKKELRSGAYIFLPDKTEAEKVPFGKVKIRVTSGDLFTRVETMHDDPFKILTQMTLVSGSPFLQMECEFHLMRNSFLSNRELLMHFETEVNNKDVFYTDLNAFQMTKRKRYSKIPIQGNVYPIPTLMYIEDSLMRFNVLTAQPLGGYSPASGAVDIFLDRQLLQDDQRGLGQGITDNRRTRLLFSLILEENVVESLKPTSDVQRRLDSLLHPVHMLEAKESADLELGKPLKLVKQKLSCDMKILNFRTSLISEKYHLTLNRYGTSCDSRCEGTHFNAAELFTPEVSNNLHSFYNQTSLSHLQVLRRDIPFSENLNVTQMDVITLEFRRR